MKFRNIFTFGRFQMKIATLATTLLFVLGMFAVLASSASAVIFAVSYTHLTLPTTPYV